MSAQHTPGPWCVKHGGIAHPFHIVTDAQFYADAAIAKLHQSAVHPVEANAHLIAAAPLLLAALKTARDCISLDRQALADTHMDPTTNTVDEDGQAGLDEYDKVLAEIDAAIAKATGAES